MSEPPVAAVAVVAVGFASLLYLGYKRTKTSIWIPMSTFEIKREKMLESTGLDHLLVVTDFDATLTTGDSEQCHDLLGSARMLSPAFRKAVAHLMDWENNPDIDGVEWWHIAHELCIKHGMPPRHLIPRMVREAKITPRPGALKLLRRLAALNVPVLIVSAGLSDVIEEFLRFHDALTENITVCSNRLNYAGDSVPKSVSPDPPITSFTKNTAYRAASSFFAEHAKRDTLIALGDSTSDIDAAINVPYKHLITVGFLNAKTVKDAPKHASMYDALVLGNDGSLAAVDALVDDVASASKKSHISRLVSSPSLLSLKRLA